MNETEIKNLIATTHDYCKKEYQEQQQKLDALGYDHLDYPIENYMTGYLKGQFKMIEQLRKSLNQNEL